MVGNLEKQLRMVELIDILNDASRKYYSSTDEESPLTDSQYDKYLKELVELEEETGIKLKGSPSLNVGYLDIENDKVKHFQPVLSLKDTKDINDLLSFINEHEALLSWKLDGVSIILHYNKGKLQLGLTRGDGHYGKDITKNVQFIKHVPLEIPFTQKLIIRGEGCIARNEFDILKRTKEGEKYKNPRNMVSGLVNATKTTNILLKRVDFIVHSVIFLEGQTDYGITTREQQFEFLEKFKLGFKIVPYQKVRNFELKYTIEHFTNNVQNFAYPVDGLVLSLNDISYGESLGATAKYPKHSIAFKWPDDIVLTRVTGMKWSISSTGLITPVVIFEPIILEGTSVRQANLHTLKKFEDLQIGIGDTLRIFKANKIIPEVEDNLTRSGTEEYPRYCPVCGAKTTVVETDVTKKLYCYNCKL